MIERGIELLTGSLDNVSHGGEWGGGDQADYESRCMNECLFHTQKRGNTCRSTTRYGLLLLLE